MKKCNVCGEMNEDNQRHCMKCKKEFAVENKSGGKGNNMTTLIIIALAVVASLGGLLAMKVVKQITKSDDIAKYGGVTTLKEYVLNQVQVGSTGVAIKSPGEFRVKQMQVPEQISGMVQKMEYYEYAESGLSINVISVNYIKGVFPDLKGAELGAVNNMKNVPGVSNFKHTSKPVTISEKRGLMLFGSMNRRSYMFVFKMLLITEGQQLWQVMVSAEKRFLKEVALIDQIIESVKIGPVQDENIQSSGQPKSK